MSRANVISDATLGRFLRVADIVEGGGTASPTQRGGRQLPVRRKHDVSTALGSVVVGRITAVDTSGINAIYDAVAIGNSALVIEEATPLDRPIAAPAVYTPRSVADLCLLLVDPTDLTVLAIVAFEQMDPAPCSEAPP